MKKIFATLLMALALGATAQEAPVHNIAGDFVRLWDATRELPMNARVEVFRQNLSALYPQFYAAQRYGGVERLNAKLAREIERFPALRPAYLAKVEDFGNAMPRHLATFRQAFPDFQLTTNTWLVHSLHEMDGGTRDFDGRTDLIFGADMMAELHAQEDVAPLFHHELFHVYHEPRFACASEAVWKNLWEEGLAVYVSHALNPRATQAELLLDFPKGMAASTAAQLPQAWAQLEQVLENSEAAMYAELFTTSHSGSALPVRRGYYLGYLVAQQASKLQDLTTLAHLSCDQAHALVSKIVHQQTAGR